MDLRVDASRGAAREEVRAWLATQEQKELLRFITCGSVDDGKSTLIGRLLYETRQIFDDQLVALEADSKRHGTQGEQIEETLGTERAFTHLLVAFAAFALFLACIGLHGLIAYSVTRRTSEIGLRIALGARRGDVLWLILRHAVGITAVGLAVGIPIAIAASRAVASLLFGVQPADPLSLSTAAVVMSVVAGLAAYLPARRAARLEPLSALRVE